MYNTSVAVLLALTYVANIQLFDVLCLWMVLDVTYSGNKSFSLTWVKAYSLNVIAKLKVYLNVYISRNKMILQFVSLVKLDTSFFYVYYIIWPDYW